MTAGPYSIGSAHWPGLSKLPYLGEFRPLPEKVFSELIEKGRQDARDLDRAIRSQFEMAEGDAALRLDERRTNHEGGGR